ncbi:hypothetical protein D9611_014950 [Ephemerocybe angulata]|uniref:ribonuclease H n=1 Tax=Ephemerocybe angulata TaxID=980116 RepID=A0A8H5BSK7_9AGAR|nr:hypothetical protein D9611_014950 [Tulosesus angulatus]
MPATLLLLQLHPAAALIAFCEGDERNTHLPHLLSPIFDRLLKPLKTEGEHQSPREDVELFTDGSCINNGTADAKCGSGVWYGEDDPRNQALRVDLPEQSNNVGELVAVLAAVQRHRGDKRLRIVSDSQYAIDAITKHAQLRLDEGFINTANKKVIQALVGELMHTKASVLTKKVKGHSGDVGNDGADRLANEGAVKPTPDPLDLSKAREVEKMGAAVHALTQAMAYRAIQARSAPKPRRNTERMIEKTRAVIDELTGVNPTRGAIWTSLRRRKMATLTQKFCAYAWRSLHEGYKLGKYWDNIDALRDDRMPCLECEAPVESMDHILRECRVSGQELVWRLAKEIWSETGHEWPYITVETVLGVGLLTVKDADGKMRMAHRERGRPLTATHGTRDKKPSARGRVWEESAER